MHSVMHFISSVNTHHTNYFTLAAVQSTAICMFVCLSIHISRATSPNFTKFSVHVTCGHGSVLHWPQCNTLCYFRFCGCLCLPADLSSLAAANALIHYQCCGLFASTVPTVDEYRKLQLENMWDITFFMLLCQIIPVTWTLRQMHCISGDT